MRVMYLGRVRDPQEEPAQGRFRVVERTARASISRRPILDRQPALP